MIAHPLVLFSESIMRGENKTTNVEIARVHTTTKLNIPIIVRRSKIHDTVVLFCARINGDKINTVQIVRQLINIPKQGTIIRFPIINVYGFVNKSREFADGRDLNQVFPVSKTGSLASQFAFHILTASMPIVNILGNFVKKGTIVAIIINPYAKI